MTQHTFAGETGNSNKSDLDGNFTQLFALYSLLTSLNSYIGVFATPTIGTDGSNKGIQINGGSSFSSNGPNMSIASNNGGTLSAPTYLFTGGGAAYYAHNGALHLWATAAAGTAGASYTFTERMRMDANGNLMIGVTSAGSLPGTGIIFGPAPAANASSLAVGHASGAASATQYANFVYAGGSIGSITQSGTSGVAYNTSSDYRLKSNVVPIAASASGAFIDALNPVDFTWISDSSAGAGFLAHELQAVSPTSVVGAKDAVMAVGNLVDSDQTLLAANTPQPAPVPDGCTWTQTGTVPVYQAVEYGSAEVIANMIAELKSLRARLAAANIA